MFGKDDYVYINDCTEGKDGNYGMLRMKRGEKKFTPIAGGLKGYFINTVDDKGNMVYTVAQNKTIVIAKTHDGGKSYKLNYSSAEREDSLKDGEVGVDGTFYGIYRKNLTVFKKEKHQKERVVDTSGIKAIYTTVYNSTRVALLSSDRKVYTL